MSPSIALQKDEHSLTYIVVALVPDLDSLSWLLMVMDGVEWWPFWAGMQMTWPSSMELCFLKVTLSKFRVPPLCLSFG